MTLREDDLDLLNEYLDGGLAADEAATVGRRVTEDAAWGQAIETLRAERSSRAAVMAALEPSVEDARHLAGRIISIADARRRRWVTIGRLSRVFGGVAACVLLS